MSDTTKTARTLIGKVVSSKMDNTVVVKVERMVAHPLYGKYIRRSTKVVAHDGSGLCAEGDTVEMHSSRPISKRKSWVVERVLAKAS